MSEVMEYAYGVHGSQVKCSLNQCQSDKDETENVDTANRYYGYGWYVAESLNEGR